MAIVSKPRRTPRNGGLRADRTVEMGKRVLGAIDTEYSRMLLRDLRAGRFEKVVSAPMPQPSSYDEADTFARDWLAYNLLKKYPGFKIPGVDPKVACWTGFAESEALNLETNCRLLWSTDRRLTNGAGVDAVFLTAQRKIRETLGRFSWDKVLPYMGHSSGATAGTPRILGAPVYKYRLRMSATPTAIPYVISFIGQDPLWVQQSIRLHGIDPQNWVDVVGGERLSDVVKNAVTRRTIGIQPSGNLAVQRGFGGYFRRALRKIGIDLNDQSVNQRLALHGSLTDRLTTWDGRNASNSLTCGLMERVFLQDSTGVLSEWYEHLNNVRCHFGVLPADASASGLPEYKKYQMFSAMGNGFTFELESLMFWAFASAVAEHRGIDATISVYGDDIVIDDVLTDDLITVLGHAGFQSNVGKTFSQGPFRESCGNHYFRGTEVTPFYIDKAIDNPIRVSWLLNSIRIWISHSVSPGLHNLWCSIVAQLPQSERRFVDAANADAGIMGEPHEARHFGGCYMRRGWRLRVASKKPFTGAHAYMAAVSPHLTPTHVNREWTNASWISDLYCKNSLNAQRFLMKAEPSGRLPKRNARERCTDVPLEYVAPSQVPEPLWLLAPYSIE